MITIQIILISCFLGMIGLIARYPDDSQIKAWKRIIIIGLFLSAIFAILFPNIVDSIAHRVGIGRGADLLLYMLTLTFFLFAINLYLQIKRLEVRLNKLASRLAISETKLKSSNSENKKTTTST